MSISTSLTAVADSIRAKTGSTDKMTIDEMPALIEAISGGGDGGALDGLEGIDGITSVTIDLTTNPSSYASITVGLTDISNDYFAGVKNIKEIKLPNVTTIGSRAIKGSDIETLDIGSSLSQTKTSSFSDAPKLSALILRCNFVPTFINVLGTPIYDGLGYIYVLDELLEQNKANNSNIANQIKPLSEL